jgi:hypothetical protein
MSLVRFSPRCSVISLFLSLDRDEAYWRARLELHGRAFDY